MMLTVSKPTANRNIECARGRHMRTVANENEGVEEERGVAYLGGLVLPDCPDRVGDSRRAVPR